MDILREYDTVGLDLDNTLALYRPEALYQMLYRHLRAAMVARRYPAEAFPEEPPLDQRDFVQRGLFFDPERGLLVKPGAEGEVTAASRGTRMLGREEVAAAYGPGGRWPEAEALAKAGLRGWRGALDPRAPAFHDLTDGPAVLLFALGVDSDFRPPGDVWRDVYRCLEDVYGASGAPGVLEAIRADPDTYLLPADPGLGDWLRGLREAGKKLIMVTGADRTDAEVTASRCLGPRWADAFHAVVFSAGKPDFFGPGKRPLKELGPRVFEGGSWGEVCRAVGCPGRAVYLGDNPLQDVAAPREAGLGAVAVLEEAGQSGPGPWGPLLGLPAAPSLWGRLFRDLDAPVIPSLRDTFFSDLHKP